MAEQERVWFEEDRNGESILWRNRRTGWVCFSRVGDGKPPRNSFRGYDDSKRLAKLGRRGYVTTSGSELYDYEPADTSPTADPVVEQKCRHNMSSITESCRYCGITSRELRDKAVPHVFNAEQPELLPAAKEWADSQPDPNLAAKQMRECGWTCPSRVWDADKYNGLADWTSLDKRIAAARAELDRPAPVRFPHPGRNFSLERGGSADG